MNDILIDKLVVFWQEIVDWLEVNCFVSMCEFVKNGFDDLYGGG